MLWPSGDMTWNLLRTFLSTQPSGRSSFLRRQGRGFNSCGLLVATLLASFAPLLHAQSALDGFDPNANGTVYAVVVQPDGKILLGGDFTTLSPNGGRAVARNRIARLNPDGTLDTAFNPNANATSCQSLCRPTARFWRVGLYGANSIGGQTRNHIARLDATTGLADSFNPNANDRCPFDRRAGGRQNLGGRLFQWSNSIGGQTRNRLARLDATTGLADSFDPNANDVVSMSIAVQADGKILAGGAFSEQLADRRATASPGSIRPPAWLIRSTRTRT